MIASALRKRRIPPRVCPCTHMRSPSCERDATSMGNGMVAVRDIPVRRFISTPQYSDESLVTIGSDDCAFADIVSPNSRVLPKPNVLPKPRVLREPTALRKLGNRCRIIVPTLPRAACRADVARMKALLITRPNFRNMQDRAPRAIQAAHPPAAEHPRADMRLPEPTRVRAPNPA